MSCFLEYLILHYHGKVRLSSSLSLLHTPGVMLEHGLTGPEPKNAGFSSHAYIPYAYTGRGFPYIGEHS